MRKLGRYSAHRIALLRNLSISLITHGKIETTLAKAKELRSFVEPLITRGKEQTLHARRILLQNLFNNEIIVDKLFEISKTMFSRPGGYTRIIKRDNSQKGIVEFVEQTQFQEQK